jgi:gluconate kinase
MTPFVTLRRALSDTHLLGGALGGDSWLAWRVLLIAAMGEPLTDEERAFFAKLTGREREPGERVDELWCVIGRSASKDSLRRHLRHHHPRHFRI